MTRILRLLLIAAVAWPFLGGTAAAQEVKPERTSFPKEITPQDVKGEVALKNIHVAPKDLSAVKLKAAPKSETNSNTIFVIESPTGTNYYIPVYGWYHDYSTTSQMIYPASLLQGLNVGDKISKLTFFTDDNGIKFNGGVLTFTIGETTTNVFSTNALMSLPSTTVSGTVVPTSGSKTLSVVFTTPLEYTGKNLFVQVENTTVGSCDPDSSNPTLWYGRSNLQNSNGNAYYASYSTRGNRQPFLPSVAIERYVDISIFNINLHPSK